MLNKGKKMFRYKYIGCFLDPFELWEKTDSFRIWRLERTVEKPHVTFVYRPDKVNETLFGARLDVLITGYACDGKNEGVQVSVKSNVEELSDLIRAISLPHITLSLAADAEAVNTRYLKYTPVTPISLQGIFGAVTEDSEVILSAPLSQ